MTFLSRLYPGDVFGPVAINVIVQVAIIALLAVIASRTFARRNAAFRHCVLLSALLWIVVSPLATARFSRAGIFTIHLAPTHTPPAAAALNEISPEHSLGAIRSLAPKVSEPSSAGLAKPDLVQFKTSAIDRTRPSVNPMESIIGGSVLLWLIVTITLLGRLACGIFKVFQIRRNARPAKTDLQAVIRRATVGLDRLPQILVSETFGSPVTIGIWRSAIILPAGPLAESNADELRDVLVHERVHAIGGDYAIGIVQRLVAAALWFHPMVHLLNREIRTAREEVCDNAVLLGRSRTDYARTLLGLCQRMQPTRSPALLPGLFDHTWPLEHRIAGILNPRRVVMTRINQFTRILVVITATGLGLALSGIGVVRAEAPANEAVSGEPATSGPTTLSSDGLTALERDADMVSPAEEALRTQLKQADRALRRAQLNLKEAEIKLRIQQTELNTKKEGLAQHVVSPGEVDQAKLDVELAEIQVERARIGLDEAAAASVPVREIGLLACDGQKKFNDPYGVRNGSPTVKEFLQQHFPDALTGGWDVSLTRASQTGPRRIFTGVLDLNASPFASARLQADDKIYVRRNIVRVLSGPGADAHVLWERPLSGKLTTVTQILKLANVQFDENDKRKVLVTGTRFDNENNGIMVGNWSWSASLSSIARGFGKAEHVESSDTIILDWPF